MKKYWFWLTNIDGVGRSTIDKLLEYYSSPNNIYNSSEEELIKVGKGIGIQEKTINNLVASRNNRDFDNEILKIKNKGIHMLTVEDVYYPEKLLNIYKHPYVLYVKGELFDSSKPSIAIVGARACDEYGAMLAKTISRTLAKKGVQVISGMAVGVDKYAHLGAVGYGKTFGVLGCGVDVCYPNTNLNVYNEICESGGLISEYPPGTKPLKHHFPERNRIISALSDGILVVQARKNSGSLITVKLGLEQGKNIYAIPGRVTDELSQGCNELIKEGAKCITGISDILEDYVLEKKKEENSNLILKENVLASTEEIVYANLRLESKHIEEIKNDTGMELPDIMQALLTLQFKGMVIQTSANYYARYIEELKKDF